MQDEKRELPNMTATEVANAALPNFPTHGILADMVEREISLLQETRHRKHAPLKDLPPLKRE